MLILLGLSGPPWNESMKTYENTKWWARLRNLNKLRNFDSYGDIASFKDLKHINKIICAYAYCIFNKSNVEMFFDIYFFLLDIIHYFENHKN